MEKFVGKLAAKWFGTGLVEDDGKACTAEEIRTDACRLSPARFDKTVNKRNHQANCILGNVGPSLYEKERIAAIVMSNILGGPANNSILNYKLREKNGWVYGVECTYTQYSDCGIVAICLGCDKDNLDKCLEVTAREISKLQDGLLSATKLAAAKKQFLGQMAISSDNGETQCLAMGKSLLAYGSVLSDESTRERIGAVTAEDIREAARKIFDREHLSKLVFL